MLEDRETCPGTELKILCLKVMQYGVVHGTHKSSFSCPCLILFLYPLKIPVLQSLTDCNNVSEGVCSEEREFSFLSDVLPEDKELRKQLQMDRLELVIRVQEEERR